MKESSKIKKCRILLNAVKNGIPETCHTDKKCDGYGREKQGTLKTCLKCPFKTQSETEITDKEYYEYLSQN